MPNTRKRFCFTQYHYDDAWLDELKRSDNIFRMVIQEERCPKTRRLHLQGFIFLHRAETFEQVHKMVPQRFDNLETARGSDWDNYKYCTKYDSSTGDHQLVVGEFVEPRTSVRARKGNALDLCIESIKEGATEAQICRDHMKTFLRYSQGTLSKLMLLFFIHYTRFL